MKKHTFFTFLCLAICANASSASNFFNNEPLALDVPQMSPEVMRIVNYPIRYDINSAPEQKMDFDFLKSKTNPDVPAFKVMDDLTFVGVPLFVAGILAKPEKKSFRQNNEGSQSNTMLLTNFKTSIDDYTQYFGPVMTVGLKLSGYEGRSDWPRLLASAGMSYGIMAAFVNGIKYTAKEMRPDGTSANSWPSGHTATSFVGATLLHKEYGLTRSPWFSVAGYGVATATGVMRVLNNRHWVSDVLSGAGIGIMSTELGYALSDIIFKQKGLLRGNIDNLNESPSFFSISMGLSIGTKDFSFSDSDLKDYYTEEDNKDAVEINFHTATTVDAEGAYFFNKYVGIGGRLRVRAMTAKNWDQFTENIKETNKLLANMFDFDDNYQLPEGELLPYNNVLRSQQVIIESDHLTEFTGSVGLYLNLPLGPHFNLGTKALVGRSITQELDINSRVQGEVTNLNYQLLIKNGEVVSDESYITNIEGTGTLYDEEWDILTMGGQNSTSFGTGLSLTYNYKSNFSWRLFVDYDYTNRAYTLKYNPIHFMSIAMPNAVSFFESFGFDLSPTEYEKKVKTNYFTFGAAFAVNF